MSEAIGGIALAFRRYPTSRRWRTTKMVTVSDPSWHHYVPQMYLKAWLDPAEKANRQHVLWVYKPGLQPKRKGTKAVAAESGFYFSEIPGAENAIEPEIAKIETIAAAHLRKLRRGDINLTAQERAEFATFMGITKFRTKFARELMNSTAIQVLRQGFDKVLREGRLPETVASLEKEQGQRFELPIEDIQKVARRVADGTTPLVQASKGWSIRNAFERGDALGDVLEQLSWGLLESPDGEAFITSDNPIHMADPPAMDAGPVNFRYSSALQFVFPISPRFLLMGDLVNRRDGKAQLSADRVAYFNVRHLEQAHEQVFASFYEKELQKLLEETFEKRPPLIRQLPPLTVD